MTFIANNIYFMGNFKTDLPEGNTEKIFQAQKFLNGNFQ